jgi:hypothetical protein
MPDTDKQFLTLLDLTATTNVDTAIGVVEVIQTYAPEFEVISGRPINGITYNVSRRRELPGGKSFRRINEPIISTASKFEKILGECFHLSRLLEVDEAFVQAQMAQYGGSVLDVLGGEVEAQLRTAAIGLGRQFYYGRTEDEGAFDGLVDFVDDSPFMCIDAGGTVNGTLSSAWLVVNSPEGVHWTFGNGQGVQAATWDRQQIARLIEEGPNKGKLGRVPSYVNNVFAWLGLGNNAPLVRKSKTDLLSVVRIANLDMTTHGLNDLLVAKAKKLFPIGAKPTHLFCTKSQGFMLAKSRYAAITDGQSQITVSGPSNFSDDVAPSCGIPVTLTDSIDDTEDKLVIA